MSTGFLFTRPRQATWCCQAQEHLGTRLADDDTAPASETKTQSHTTQGMSGHTQQQRKKSCYGGLQPATHGQCDNGAPHNTV